MPKFKRQNFWCWRVLVVDRVWWPGVHTHIYYKYWRKPCNPYDFWYRYTLKWAPSNSCKLHWDLWEVVCTFLHGQKRVFLANNSGTIKLNFSESICIRKKSEPVVFFFSMLIKHSQTTVHSFPIPPFILRACCDEKMVLAALNSAWLTCLLTLNKCHNDRNNCCSFFFDINKAQPNHGPFVSNPPL